MEDQGKGKKALYVDDEDVAPLVRNPGKVTF